MSTSVAHTQTRSAGSEATYGTPPAVSPEIEEWSRASERAWRLDVAGDPKTILSITPRVLARRSHGSFS